MARMFLISTDITKYPVRILVCCTLLVVAADAGVIQDTIITGLSPNSITVTTGKDTKTYIVTRLPEISLNGQRAAFNELKKGMRASVAADADPTKASRITATGPK